MAVLFSSSTSAATLIAVGAGVLGASALAGGVASAGRMGLSPGRRALIHWTPIAMAVLVARWHGAWDIALGIIFGTSVAVMSTVLGSVCAAGPVGPAPAGWKRVWPFTLVAALIVYVSGFNGLLNWKHGIALLVEGIALFSLWREAEGSDWIDPAQHRAEDLAPRWLEWGALVVGILLAAGGAYFATKGATQLHGRVRLSPGTIGSTLLSLVLVAPMAQGDRRLAVAGASWLAATAEFGVVLLNLCVLLPVMAFVPYLGAYVRGAKASHGFLIDPSKYDLHLTEFPLALWRIDTVAIVLLSLLVLPVAMGKWNLAREEGVLLIAAYCIYIVAVTVAGLGVM